MRPWKKLVCEAWPRWTWERDPLLMPAPWPGRDQKPSRPSSPAARSRRTTSWSPRRSASPSWRCTWWWRAWRTRTGARTASPWKTSSESKHTRFEGVFPQHSNHLLVRTGGILWGWGGSSEYVFSAKWSHCWEDRHYYQLHVSLPGIGTPFQRRGGRSFQKICNICITKTSGWNTVCKIHENPSALVCKVIPIPRLFYVNQVISLFQPVNLKCCPGAREGFLLQP